MRSATEVTRIVLCATGLPRGLQKAAEGFDAKDAKFPMPMRFPHTMLSTLTEWSAKHTEAIFAAKTVDECLIAIDQTFAIDVSGTGNGKSLTREDISKSVLSLRERSETGLKVRWRESVEIPSDAENTGGTFGGVYVISGIHESLPGIDGGREIERRKAVIVKIQSGELGQEDDGRRIVEITFVAMDVVVGEFIG